MSIPRQLIIILFALALPLLAEEDIGRILFVVTNHTELGTTGRQTGYFLSEVTHPHHVLHEAGYKIDFVSPQGGAVHMDPKSRNLDDPINRRFVADKAVMKRLETTLSPAQVEPKAYRAIFFAGGHGAMWDFPNNERLADITATIYQAGGIVAAVCHGPAGLVNVTLENGRHLLAGHRVTGFTNAEEEAVKLTGQMPFLLETKLKERGAHFIGAPDFQENAVVSGRLVTGQNPASATAVGSAIKALLAGTRPTLDLVAESPHQWTGIALSQQGRTFVNFPRWSDSIPMSVGELQADGTLKPYPNQLINSWEEGKDPADHFVCVQSVVVDNRNRLWILDPANPRFKGIVASGPKLMQVDLESNQPLRTYRFVPPVIHPDSYLNDVRVDTERNIAYISDSGRGAIIVLDLESGKAQRRLDGHPSTSAADIDLIIGGNPWRRPDGSRPQVHCDGIALTGDGDTLYYQALTGRHLYSIPTIHLRDAALGDEELADHVELRVEAGASDGLIIGPDGSLYLSSLEYDAVRRWKPGMDYPEILVQDSRISWPDSFAFDSDGWLYFTTSQIHHGQAPPEPYRIYRVKPWTKATPTSTP